jgi:hypothetical protein
MSKPTDAQQRFERALRAQARQADAMSAGAEGSPDIAARNTGAGDELRQRADDFRVTMDSSELEYLEGMSDEEMRAVASSIRLLSGRDEGGDA